MKLVIGIALIVVVIYAGLMLVPPYWANYQFEDGIKTEALMGTNSSKTEDAIRDSVYKRAKDLELPLEKNDIKVVRVGYQGGGSVTITASYIVHLNVPGYPVDLHFDPATTNKGVF